MQSAEVGVGGAREEGYGRDEKRGRGLLVAVEKSGSNGKGQKEFMNVAACEP